jgi:hypothetical protein
MSKMDDLRAMREARFETPPPSSDETSPDEHRCGHRAISGRTCTREQGHAARSHRYS